VPAGVAEKERIMNRLVALDLLRGLAAWAVAISHFFSYHAIQWETFEIISIMAVEIFFVLSGYVLAGQILLCVAAAKPRLYLVFLTRRWMRTVPAYVVALVVVSILFRQLGSADFFRYLGYVQNLFRQSNHHDYYSIAWSLSVEEWFYVVFPGLLLIGSLLARRSDMYFVVALTTIFIGIVTVARTFLGGFDDWGAAVRRVVVFRVDAIAYGFLLYVIAERAFSVHFTKLSLGAISVAVVASTVLLFWGTASIDADNSLLGKHLFSPLAAIFGSSCILAAIKTESIVASQRWLAVAALWGGRTSYSTYLFHMIFLVGLGSVEGSLPLTLKLLTYVVVVALFTSIFYRTFEQPILLARPKLQGSPA
jgi:peptidoglycan/LPS O-acetylase OafA/YrhL